MRAPVFIIGRQHSGNTMLASMLGRHPDVLGLRNEGAFFEHQSRLDALPSDERVDRIAEIVARETSGEIEISPELLREKLRAFYESREETSAAALYKTGMAWVTEQYGASRWVRKATSYVFYIDDILQVFPEAYLVYLVRNPLDIAASLKRRGEWRRVMRMVWGWNQGTQAAMNWEETQSDRVRLVRYEDVVRTPKKTMQDLCAFANLTFEDSLLDVPHVNRSETPYNQDSSQSGLSTSRVHYYSDVLTAAEEAVVRTGSNANVFASCYPGLPPARDCDASSLILALSRAVITSTQTLVSDHLSACFSEPRHVFDRIRRRIE